MYTNIKVALQENFQPKECCQYYSLARNPTRVKGGNNVLVYREVTDHRITFVYQNKSESSSTIQMELTKSKGIVHSRESEVSLIPVYSLDGEQHFHVQQRESEIVSLAFISSLSN